jgi:hypothetical protein
MENKEKELFEAIRLISLNKGDLSSDNYLTKQFFNRTDISEQKKEAILKLNKELMNNN